jgi:hypothetical protein
MRAHNISTEHTPACAILFDPVAFEHGGLDSRDDYFRSQRRQDIFSRFQQGSSASASRSQDSLAPTTEQWFVRELARAVQRARMP